MLVINNIGVQKVFKLLCCVCYKFREYANDAKV